MMLASNELPNQVWSFFITFIFLKANFFDQVEHVLQY